MKPGILILIAALVLTGATPNPASSPKITWDATGNIPSCPAGYYDPGNSLHCSKGHDPRCHNGMCAAVPITLMDGDRHKFSETWELSVEALTIHGKRVYRVGRGDAYCCWSGPKDYYTGRTLREALIKYAQHEHP